MDFLSFLSAMFCGFHCASLVPTWLIPRIFDFLDDVVSVIVLLFVASV